MRELWGLELTDPAFLQLTCTSAEFAQSGDISEEMAMVLVNLGVLNVQTCARFSRGRAQETGTPSNASALSRQEQGRSAQRRVVFKGHLEEAAWILLPVARRREVARAQLRGVRALV